MEDYLTAQQAATLLHLHPKRVQALARAGKLPAVRTGRKWLFPRSALLARLRGAEGGAVPSASHLSGRNQIKGRINAISVDGVMAEVRIEIGGHELVSIITRASVKSSGRIGICLTRFPVAAKTAFATAGAMGGTPISPMPIGRSSLSTMYTSTFGISSNCRSG